MAQINLTLDEEIVKGLFLGGSEAAMKELLEKVIDAILQKEVEAQIGAGSYERSEERQCYRNGYRERSLTTRVGALTIQIPKLREGTFTTELFGRYQRNEQALMLTLMEMVVKGVSTRKISAITEQLCGTKFSAQTVSSLCQMLDPEIKAFRERPLTGPYPFVCCDAIYMRTHQDRRVDSTALLIAIGVNGEGKREVLGFDVMKSESTGSWKVFFQGLLDRGLSGVELVTSDAHCGIKAAIKEKFCGAAWQRCQTHFSRNVLERCPKGIREEVHRALNDMYNAPDLESCKERLQAILEQYGEVAKAAMQVLEEGFYDVISIYALPPHYRKKLRTSNSLERLNEELRRRERVIRIFPNQESLIRLMGAILLEQHEAWISGRTYIRMDDWAAEKIFPTPSGVGKKEQPAA